MPMSMYEPITDGQHYIMQYHGGKMSIVQYLIDTCLADITITNHNGDNIFDFVCNTMYRTGIGLASF
jgi:hypothetical protein